MSCFLVLPIAHRGPEPVVAGIAGYSTRNWADWEFGGAGLRFVESQDLKLRTRSESVNRRLKNASAPDCAGPPTFPDAHVRHCGSGLLHSNAWQTTQGPWVVG